jgi:hypothetical protein
MPALLRSGGMKYASNKRSSGKKERAIREQVQRFSTTGPAEIYRFFLYNTVRKS